MSVEVVRALRRFGNLKKTKEKRLPKVNCRANNLWGRQYTWDKIDSKAIPEQLLEKASDASNKARLSAAFTLEARAWLHALPSPNFGTLLEDNSLWVAMSTRRGKFPRHYALNDIIHRALISTNFPCTLEPPGLSRSDAKRPDE
ncbi:hypothetical protein EVAR_39871_1 [Eumeta japonica]|uniref:Uncharacterized protein n=1 Tax=Eumeta variegata TaxID=151549 RepID=A0A4C1WU76_EUMVA|nr:hypothetical protein EVAR_39871_1 [Eumeta japonica]